MESVIMESICVLRAIFRSEVARVAMVHLYPMYTTAALYSVHIIVIVNRKDAVEELNCYAAVNTCVLSTVANIGQPML